MGSARVGYGVVEVVREREGGVDGVVGVMDIKRGAWMELVSDVGCFGKLRMGLKN